MKKQIIVIIFIFALMSLYAQAPVWEWVKQVGGYGYDYGRAVVTDNYGNQYVSGYFQDTITLGSFTLTSNGDHDLYVAKLDNNGNWLWARRCGGNLDDYNRGVTIDINGNVYLTGYFQGTANFGSTLLTSSGSYDIVVAKLDNNGNWQWAKKAGSTTSDWGYWIDVDTASNVYLTGHFTGAATFGTTVLESNGGYDAFVTSLDSNGNWLWAKQAGGTGNDFGFCLALDNYANVYLTGHFTETATFGTTNLTSSGLNDIFIAKLDSGGNWAWAKQAGGTNDDVGCGITVDNSSHAIITGYFSGTASFGTTQLTSSGGFDIFGCKLDTNGNILWAKRAGGTGNDRGNGIAVDLASNVYLTGYFSTNSDFGATMLSSSGSNDIFATKLDSNGNFLWATRAGGYGTDQGFAIAVDLYANVFVTGYFRDFAAFGTTTLYSNGSEDVFVAKLQGEDTPLPVELSSFTATLISNDFVQVNWVTESENNLTGYYVYRNTENNLSTALQIPYLILANNTSLEQHYSFDDREVDTGFTYYYWLESLEISNESEFHGPVSVNVDDGSVTPPVIPAASELLSANPNPFHSGESTMIKVRIADDESGTVSIYNSRGQRLKSYYFTPGEFEVSLYGNNLVSGVYFCRLQTQSINTVKKLFLIK